MNEKWKPKFTSVWSNFWVSKFPYLKKDYDFIRKKKIFIIGNYGRRAGALKSYKKRISEIKQHAKDLCEKEKSTFCNLLANFEIEQFYTSEEYGVWIVDIYRIVEMIIFALNA